MAKFAELNPDAFNAWVSSRPTIVANLVARLPPDRLYLMKSTGEYVTVFSYGENGTVAVNVRKKLRLQSIERRVFGVSPDDLEECDLPDGLAIVP